MITIITPYLNNPEGLRILYNNISTQTCTPTEWIIVDGGSAIPLSHILPSPSSFNIKYLQAIGSSIYSAINTALQTISSNWYVVVGSDDQIYENFIASYVKIISNCPSYVLAVSLTVDFGDSKSRHPTGRNWIYKHGISSIISSHSVGCAINVNLHDRYGYYDNTYILAADQKLLLEVYSGNPQSILYCKSSPVGWYSPAGSSATKYILLIHEMLRLAIEANRSFPLHFFIYIFRFLRFKSS